MVEVDMATPESTYIVAAVFGVIYALILSAGIGRRFASGQGTAWVAMAIGVIITWLAAYVTGGEFTLMLFVFSGTPIAIRSAVLSEMRNRSAAQKAFDVEAS